MLVEVDGEPVTLPMLEFLMEVQGVSENDHEGMRRVLDELVRLRAVANRARAEGLSDKPEVRAERLIKDIEVQYLRLLEKHQRDNPVTDAEIRAAYDRQVERAGDRRYRLETIEFADQAAALEALQRLETGTEFREEIERATAEGRLARRTDWIDLSQVPPDFGEILAETSAGEVIETPMPYQAQWLVVRVAEIDALAPPAFDEVREGIRRSLARERAQALIDAIVDAAEVTPVLPLGEAREPGAD
ncbi:MAG: peptidylprolyl isomerase [Wenzhouxiangellaceae bacterium]|nr:peptidylprolyl isomerase [Wenzhouxiangellaceae bacterium]